jgi:FlaA1/EpsC-like NDP-sugar epimerase|tara:strand:+ start:407 stop:1249 length:843 start_codon:yes stop_codon:yes gene_type:complete
MIIKGEKYLITGGTGVVGQELCKRIIELGGKVIVLSRTEEKLNKLKEKYNQIEIVVSDILDDELVKKSIDDVRGVFHLTALAQGMQSGTPIHSINVNILGSMNVLSESLDKDFVLGISSDKAATVSSPYGATKFLMESLFSEFESVNPKTKYRVVRLGNVMYSHDSVLEKWKTKIQNNEEVIITEPTATRFFITKEHSVDMIFNCLERSIDSTPYFEKMKSTSMGNLLQAMSNKYLKEGNQLKVKQIGLQRGENLHEMISNGYFSSHVEQHTIKELEDLI